MPEPASLHEFLTREFGVDLPIRGGPGTQAAPIIVTTTDLQQAVDVQMQVLQLLAKARQVAWRLTAQEVVAHVGRTVQTTIETVAYANSQVVTQREAIHFLLEALPDDGTSIDAARGEWIRGSALGSAAAGTVGLAAPAGRG